jgi:hypothetical protein
LLRRKAEKLRKETGDYRWQAPIENMNRSIARTVLQSLYRPVLLLTLEPMCLNLCIFSAILLGMLCITTDPQIAGLATRDQSVILT